jgi:hypothetical protein
MSEIIEYKSVVYDITEIGLVSEAYRRKNAKGDQSYLDREPVESEVMCCIDWIDQYTTPRKTANTRTSSYGLKHVVEKWAGTYISNGAFILAAKRKGVKIVPFDPSSPNVWFCLSYKMTPACL